MTRPETKATNAASANRPSLPAAFLFSAAALAAFGATRLLFNLLGLRFFSPELVGRVNATLAGAATVAVLCGAPIGTALTTAVAQSAAYADQTRTRKTLAAYWVAGITIIAAVAALWYALGGIDGSLYSAGYLLSFGCYLLTRAAMLGELRHDLLARFEIAGLVASLTGLAVACISHSTPIAMLVLFIHPTVVACLALFRNRTLITSFSWRQTRHEFHTHRGLIGASFLLSLSGLASYHLILIILSARGRPEAEIGIIATLLSALNTLSFAPLALSMILAPEQARQQGLGNSLRQQELVRRPTFALQAFFSAVFLLTVGAATYVLPLLGISASDGHLTFWGVACASVYLSIISTPSGSFLNGISAASEQAVIAIVFFSLGCASSWMISAYSGLGGAAAMLFCSVGLASLARIIAADTKAGCLEPHRSAFWLRTTMVIVSLFALNYIPSIVVRVGVSAGLVALHWSAWRRLIREFASRARRWLAPKVPP